MPYCTKPIVPSSPFFNSNTYFLNVLINEISSPLVTGTPLLIKYTLHFFNIFPDTTFIPGTIIYFFFCFIVKSSTISHFALSTPFIVFSFFWNDASFKSLSKLWINLWVRGGSAPYKWFLASELTPEPKVNIWALQFFAYYKSPTVTSPTSVLIKLSFTFVSDSIVGLSFYNCIKIVYSIPLSPNFIIKLSVSGLSPEFLRY